MFAEVPNLFVRSLTEVAANGVTIPLAPGTLEVASSHPALVATLIRPSWPKIKQNAQQTCSTKLPTGLRPGLRVASSAPRGLQRTGPGGAPRTRSRAPRVHRP